MASDNTLGAPTEGLGQRVTFAPNMQGGVPQLSFGGGSSDIRVGVVGAAAPGGVVQGEFVAPRPNPTLGVLMKVADNIIRPQLKKRQTEAYVSGMQRAMQGEAVADIAATEPWYSKVFGTGADVVEGARAYDAQTAAQTQIASLEDRMPELRKMGPEDARKLYIGTVDKAMTGDAAVDGARMQAFTRAMPGLMRRQSKEHYGYLQETATASEAQAFKAGAQRLQGAAKGLSSGMVTQQEYDGITDQFVRSLTPSMGRDPDSYKKSMAANLVGWAQSGNFHALNAVTQERTDPDGVTHSFLDVLDAQQRTAFDKAREQGEAKLRTRYSSDWSKPLAQINALSSEPDQGMTSEDIKKRIDTINEDYRKETGVRTGLVSPSESVALQSRSALAIKREYERQAQVALANSEKLRAAGAKAEAAESDENTVREAAAKGVMGILKENPGWSNKVTVPFAKHYENAPTPEAKIKLLNDNWGSRYKDDIVANTLQGQISKSMMADQPGPAFNEAFAGYVAMRNVNPELADVYYGSHAKALDGMYTDVYLMKADPVGSFRDRFVNKNAPARLPKETKEAAVKTVTSTFQSAWKPAWMGDVKLKAGQANRIVNELSDEIEAFTATTGDPVLATKRAINLAKEQGVEVMGGYVFHTGKDQKSLESWLTSDAGRKAAGATSALASDKINEHFENAVNEVLYGDDDTTGVLPDKADDISVIRLPDPAGGAPLFHVLSLVEGKQYRASLSANDVFALSAKRAARKKNTTFGIKDSSLKFGPVNRFQPADDAPSIYGR